MKTLKLFLLLWVLGITPFVLAQTVRIPGNRTVGGVLTTAGLTSTGLTSATNTFGANPGFNTASWNLGMFRVGDSNAATNSNFYNFVSQLDMLPSGSSSDFAKSAMLGWCQTDDNTATAPNFRDCIGVTGYATIGNAVTNGRAFGFNALAAVGSPADGNATGAELDVINSSSEVTTFSPSLGKFGLVINSAGTGRPTAGVLIGSSNTTTNGWFYGVAVNSIAVGGIPYYYGQAGTTTCASTGIGSTGTCTMGTGSQDLWGDMTFTPGGSGITSTGTATLTFSQQLGGNTPVCMFQLVNGSGGWQPTATVIVNGRATTSFAVQWTNAATNFDNTHTWSIDYHCEAK